jgi:beta-lactamase superfamily II metal-dependent hydrolase
MPFIAEDIVRFVPNGAAKPFNLYWGEEIDVVGFRNGRTELRAVERGDNGVLGTVKGRLPTQDKRPLHFMMVDVQQGDGMIMVTPEGKKLFFDGGDNKLFARFAANRFRGSSKNNPLEVDCMIVTHGDADHYKGLSDIVKSEKHGTARKRLFIHPKRVYHNGLVKGPGRKNNKPVPAERIFGTSVAMRGGRRAAISLVDKLTSVRDSRLNVPFRQWKKSLKHWEKHGPIQYNRIAQGNRQEFQFLRSEGLEVDVLGPREVSVTHRGKRRRGLELLRQPPKDANISVAGFGTTDRKFSASHTINGQSLSLRITYGNVRFFLSGDLNQESMADIKKRFRPSELQSEILKVPHHGSADFDLSLLKQISPVVSLISSGDENSKKEHIHPRATLMGALGKVARDNVSLVFCTELAAFFEYRKLCRQVGTQKTFHGFERTNFGIIHIRTDGERVLVFTHSGKQGMNEAYRFTVDKRHRVRIAKSIKKR